MSCSFFTRSFLRPLAGICFILLLFSSCASDKQAEKKEITFGPKEKTISTDILKQYVGTYELAPNFKMMITLEGDQLISQATGQGKVPLYAMSETKFFPKVVEAQIEFFKDDKGNITHLVLYQGGREMKAPKISDKVIVPKYPDEVTVATGILKQYVGTYELAPNFKIMITLEGSQLMAQATGQTKNPLYAMSEMKFFFKVVEAQIEFFKDSKGNVTHLVLYQGGRETKGERISETVLTQKEIKLSQSILVRYIGTYELQPGMDVFITVDGDQLFAQATGQQKVPIYPETETKFFYKVVDATIEFLKDNDGAVTHLILNQGPANIKAPKK